QFHSVASFLMRRGWPTEVSSSLNKVIQTLSTAPADFVLVSVNHSSPKINMLPNLLAQTFNTSCIAFAEKTDNKSIGALNSIRTQHKMMGPVSGPSIHRKIKAILSEKYGETPATPSAESSANGLKSN